MVPVREIGSKGGQGSEVAEELLPVLEDILNWIPRMYLPASDGQMWILIRALVLRDLADHPPEMVEMMKYVECE